MRARARLLNRCTAPLSACRRQVDELERQGDSLVAALRAAVQDAQDQARQPAPEPGPSVILRCLLPLARHRCLSTSPLTRTCAARLTAAAEWSGAPALSWLLRC